MIAQSISKHGFLSARFSEKGKFYDFLIVDVVISPSFWIFVKIFRIPYFFKSINRLFWLKSVWDLVKPQSYSICIKAINKKPNNEKQFLNNLAPTIEAKSKTEPSFPPGNNSQPEDLRRKLCAAN
jgi:hypothetical protein